MERAHGCNFVEEMPRWVRGTSWFKSARRFMGDLDRSGARTPHHDRQGSAGVPPTKEAAAFAFAWLSYTGSDMPLAAIILCSVIDRRWPASSAPCHVQA
jgi:hypothetical protein